MTRVLTVDDKEDNLYYLQALLTGNGCEVETAQHGAEALVKARQNPPDLIISDLLMPVMDGFTLLRHWKADARLKQAPFIVYTATYTESEDEQLALNLGADAFILKPAEPEDLLARIREVQSKAAGSREAEPRTPPSDDAGLLKSYSEVLIRKLEEKTLQLEESNKALQEDIAERQRANARLRESEERFRELAETMKEVFCIASPDNSVIHYVSLAFGKSGCAIAPACMRRRSRGWTQFIPTTASTYNLRRNPSSCAASSTRPTASSDPTARSAGFATAPSRFAGMLVKSCASSEPPKTSRIGGNSRNNIAKRRRWRRSATSPEGWRTTSTTSSRQFSVIAITVSSQPGQGTTFRVCFPAAAETVFAATPLSVPHPGAGQHILYLDDEEPLVIFATRMLDRLGYRASGFTSPVEAMTAFRETPDEFDLVIVDMSMPGTSGIQFAADMLLVRPNLPVVLCSGHVTEDLRQRARNAGIRDVLHKQNSMEEFSEAIHHFAATTVNARM